MLGVSAPGCLAATGLTDSLFATKAAEGGLTEVELGRIAEQNGGTVQVRDFGAKMVTDHGKVNDNLKALAARDNLTIPDKPSIEQQALIDKLSKETGGTFDRDYIHAMVTAHKGDKGLFTEEIDTAKNPDLGRFASNTLPIIKEHLAMIEKIADGQNQSAAMGGTRDMGSSANSAPTASQQ